jgi:hypothetical protein
MLHPQWLLQHWNWKAAVLASVLRGTIFFVSTLKSGLHAAAAAMLVECSYRALTSGFWGAITQALQPAEPAWLATVAALILIPLLAHGLQLLIHLVEGTPRLWIGMLTSVLFTVISTLFNLYAMRRGAMLVGTKSRSFASDMLRMPRLIAGFIAAGPRFMWRFIRR